MKRQRGRGGQGGGQRRPGQGGNNSNRSFDSNGPDVKVRGPASHIYERYMQLARDANSAGDRIQAENFLQHAEHYYRVFRAMQPVAPPPQLTERYGDDIDFDGDETTAEGEEGADGDVRQEQHAHQNQRGDYRERDQRRDYQQQPREHRGDYQQRDRGEYRDRDQQRGEYRERGNGEYRDRDQQRGEYRGDRQDNRDRPDNRDRQDNRDRADSRERQDRDQHPRENAEGGEQAYAQGAPQGAAEGQDGDGRRNRRGRRSRYREGGPRPEGDGGENAPETGGFGEAAPAFLTND